MREEREVSATRRDLVGVGMIERCSQLRVDGSSLFRAHSGVCMQQEGGVGCPSPPVGLTMQNVSA